MPFYSRRNMMHIGDAVANTLSNAFKHPTQSEPQLVANLVFEFPKQINKAICPGTMKVTAGGVFVHSRPFVACKSFPQPTPASVEIGDLLLIRTLVVSGKVVENRALLLQAKKTDSIPVTPDNKNQWHLYEQWPGFTYAPRSGGLTGKPRHIKEPDMYEASKYLLIGTGSAALGQYCACCSYWPFHWHCHWPEIGLHHTAQPTRPKISRYKCFAGDLVDFIAGNAGKVFVKPKPRTRGWNRVIQDLIDETAKAKTIFIGRAAGQSTSAMRENGVLFCSLAGHSSFSLFGGGDDGAANNVDKTPNVPAEWNGDDNGGGISIIEFVVEQGEG